MRIFVSHPSAYLTDHAPHGDGRVAYDFISRLAHRGHRVHVAAPTTALRDRLHSNIVIHDCKPRVAFVTLEPLEYMVRVRSVYTRVNALETIDVIHQLNPVEPGLSRLLTGRGTTAPLVLGPYIPSWPDHHSIDGGLQMSHLGRIGYAMTNLLLARADVVQERRAAAFLLSTPAARSALQEPERAQARAVWLGAGVDVTEFVPGGPEATDGAPPLRVLFLANLVERKGVLTLLDAFDRVADAVPDVRLRIAGSGVAFDVVRDRIAALRHRDAVEMVGAVPRERVAGMMQDCSVYCLPSYGEPYGVSALEAMACGKPVVATAASGLQFLVDRAGGRLVPPRDPEALADALIEVLSSTELQRSMGAYNRQKALRTHSWDAVIDRLEHVYEWVTGVRADPPPDDDGSRREPLLALEG